MTNFSELSEYNLKSILLGTDNSEAIVLQQISFACSKMSSSLAQDINEHCNRVDEFNQQIKINSHTSSEVNDHITTAKKKLDTIFFNKKVLEKETSNVINLIEKLQENLKDMRQTRDTLALEIIDLERELEERKRDKKCDYDAIKHACAIYKEKLDIRITMDVQNNAEKLTVIFFVKEANDEYYVDLTYKNNLWRVDNIEPNLEPKHREELKKAVEFSTDNQVKDIRAFLCQLRRIFHKHYLKK